MNGTETTPACRYYCYYYYCCEFSADADAATHIFALARTVGPNWPPIEVGVGLHFPVLFLVAHFIQVQ